MSHLLSCIGAPNVMRVSNEHFNDDDDELGASWHSSRLKRVDWAKAEAQVEAEFSAQRALLIHRLRDRDYPYPEVINQLARLVVGNFS
ncbi:hypothetical protein OAK15_01280 [Verrucomicrobia bacterium]|nr:hypothetical protein [Verrucomicrobiota bacterium]